MQNFLNWLSAFFASYGPWILTALIPTIITGLSKSPKTAGAVTWVQKGANILKQVMDFLSVLTHKDVPGTFQMPLKLNRKKKGPPSVGPGCAAIMALALLASSSQSACGWIHSDTVNDIKNSTIDCTIEAVKSNAASLLPVVMTIVTGSSGNWKQQLAAIGKEFGRDALACSLQMAAIDLQENAKMGGASETYIEAAATALSKAHGYMAEQKYTYAHEE
jgi:hypothetical protein